MTDEAYRIPGFTRGRSVTIEVDGESLTAHEGETVAMALYAAGRRVVRQSSRLAAPRGVFCNMGVCYECLIYVGQRAQRSCMLSVQDGMRLRTWRPEESGPGEEIL